MSCYLISCLLLVVSVYANNSQEIENLKKEDDYRNTKVEESFIANGIVPDVVPKAPKTLATVNYPSGVEVRLGNELTPTQVKDIPTVTWSLDPDCFYTLAMVDPDAPSRAAPIEREFEHWLVGNIPGAVPYIGETLAEYIGAAPPPFTGLHRYVFLVYKQPSVLEFDEPRLNNTSMEGRVLFSIAKFAEKHKLGDPVAGNFYLAQYDNYVPILHAQFGDYSLLPYLIF